MLSSESVSQWITDLKGGESLAVGRLYERYWQRLVTLCERRLRTARKRMEDEEGIAARVFESICLGAKAGRFDAIQNRDDLWWTMMRVTKQKIVDHIRREEAQKRSPERSMSDLAAYGDDSAQVGLATYSNIDFTPDAIVESEEHLEHLFSLLRNDELRSIALLRIEGYTAVGIADRLNSSVRTIERKLALIRETWRATLDGKSDSENG